jgi:glucose/arabinose dehydrogenase
MTREPSQRFRTTQDFSSKERLGRFLRYLASEGRQVCMKATTKISGVVLLSFALALSVTAPAVADVVVPSGFSTAPVTDRLTKPMDLAFAPDGRLFVAEQNGRVRIVRPDGSLITFLDIRNKVDRTGERGLSAIAFDPEFATTGYVFLQYTRAATSSAPAHDRIVRVTANGNAAVAGSERLIFRLPALDDIFHIGAALTFGDDGRLYITTGDNVGGESQLLSNLVGKVLRINDTGTIPNTNPYFGSLSGKLRAIWAAGLRNPFKIVDDPGSGTMFVNDVGEDTWEEINRVQAGANFGWRLYEGTVNQQGYTDPEFEYAHDGDVATTGCAITGGAFSRGSLFPQSYAGDYLFADYCNGWIRSYDVGSGVASDFLSGASSIVDVAFGNDGNLYYLSRGTPATIHRVTYSPA